MGESDLERDRLLKEVSPLLPNPCHFQNYDQSMSLLSSGSEGCSLNKSA